MGFIGYLKFSHELAVDVIFEPKGQAAVPHPVFPPENAGAVAQIEDEQVVALGLKRLQGAVLQGGQQVVV